MNLVYIFSIGISLQMANEFVLGVSGKCMEKFDIDICFANATSIPCSQNSVCGKVFNMSYVNVQPYSDLILADLIRRCCGDCVKVSLIHQIDLISQITPSVMDTSHFVFPVLGRADAKKLYGHHFIPLIETPSVYFITSKEDDLLQNLVSACLQMWPLVIMCFMMVLVSGFLQWSVDTWVNEAQFPRSLFVGWFEGIWWSFISMTTVGYGDKCPKSVAGRLLTIVWIFIGITTFSLVTAMLSSEITKVNHKHPPEISEAKVGSLPHRLYDAILIAQHGGIRKESTTVNSTDAIHNLIKMLKTKEIDGFVLDRYTLIVIIDYLDKADADFLRSKTIRTEISYIGDKLSYGMLVKNIEDYDFFADFVIDNLNVINTCSNIVINEGSRRIRVNDVENPLFSIHGGVFWPSFTIISCLIVVMCIYGAIYEILRRKVYRHEKNCLLT